VKSFLFTYLLTALRYFWSVQALRYDKNRIVLRIARLENQKQVCCRRYKDNNIFQIRYRNIKDDHAKCRPKRHRATAKNACL